MENISLLIKKQNTYIHQSVSTKERFQVKILIYLKKSYVYKKGFNNKRECLAISRVRQKKIRIYFVWNDDTNI